MEIRRAWTVGAPPKINRQNAQKAKGVPLASAVPTVFSTQPLRKGVTY
jgi:hypothetical protein